jgi:hypothetical protein
LEGGWSTTGTSSQIPRIRKIGDIVYIEGAARQTGAFTASNITTLPSTYWPPIAKRYQLGAHKVAVGGNYIARVSISATGVMAVSEYSAPAGATRDDPLVYLDMITPYSVT